MRPFLLISPFFAPQASVGAFRWVKLARHLPRHGLRPVVLSATFPDDLRDDGLLAALPPEVHVENTYLDPAVLAAGAAFSAVRARLPLRQAPRPLVGLRPFRALTDRCLPHAPHAARAAVELARRSGARAVVVSAGPFSACSVGLHVKRALGLPLVLDLRDPFSLHETGHGPPSGLAERARRALVPRLERRWLEHADHVILNTRRTLEAYRARFPELSSKSSFVRNHFDLSLYAAPAPAQAPPDRFVILHLGTLREETSADHIGAALRRLIDRERLAPGDVVLRQIGRMSAYDHDRFERMGLTPFVEARPSIPQRDVLGELRRAHVLFTMCSPHVVLRISAKTYDYIASGMPIVSATANREVDELLAHRSDNARVEPDDIDGIAAALARHLARFRETGALPTPVPPPSELSSEAAAARIAAILDGVIGARAGRAEAGRPL